MLERPTNILLRFMFSYMNKILLCVQAGTILMMLSAGQHVLAHICVRLISRPYMKGQGDGDLQCSMSNLS